MQRDSVVSSSVVSVGYENEVLEVEFSSGRVYRYHGVAKEDYEGLKASESKGRYVRERIVSQYRGERSG
jgi:hypothetical protein